MYVWSSTYTPRVSERGRHYFAIDIPRFSLAILLLRTHTNSIASGTSSARDPTAPPTIVRRLFEEDGASGGIIIVDGDGLGGEDSSSVNVTVASVAWRLLYEEAGD